NSGLRTAMFRNNNCSQIAPYVGPGLESQLPWLPGRTTGAHFKFYLLSVLHSSHRSSIGTRALGGPLKSGDKLCSRVNNRKSYGFYTPVDLYLSSATILSYKSS